jgi:hypothetical protein
VYIRRMAGRPTEHIKNIPLCIVLTLATCGIYNCYWQYTKMLSANELLLEDKYSFWPWLLLCLCTCGLYHIYHQYRIGQDIVSVAAPDQKNDGLIAIVVSLFGLSIIADAIQQSRINSYYGDDSL